VVSAYGAVKPCRLLELEFATLDIMSRLYIILRFDDTNHLTFFGQIVGQNFHMHHAVQFAVCCILCAVT